MADLTRLFNVALVSHGGAGKTSLTEALLFRSGAVTRLGKVEDGSTTTDFDPDELKRHMSVSLALAPLTWRNCQINLIDTPGYADFFGEVVEATRAADAVIVVIDGVSGIQVGTEAAWRQANKLDLPRLIFVNKLERENADYETVITALRDRYGTGIVPLTIPIGKEHDLHGIAEILHRRAYLDGGEASAPSGALAEEIERYREMLVEAVSEQDDDLLAKYLEGEEISDDELSEGLAQAVRAGKLVPVLCGTAIPPRGIESLLDAIVDHLPDASQAHVRMEDGSIKSPSELPFAGLVIKSISDPFIGRLSYVRVFSGELHPDCHLWNVNKAHDERVGQVYHMRGKHQEPIRCARVGDIAVIPKLAETSTGDTLVMKDHPVLLAPIEFPEPSFSAAIEPKSKADVDKLSLALQRIMEEDPTLHVRREESTGETIMSGLGESHVEIAVERMARKFSAHVAIHTPSVPYRETITGIGKATGRYVRQTGGHGQYGVAVIEVEPLERGGVFEFVDKIVGGVVPRQFIPAVEKGVREALDFGIVAGFPVVDVRVSLVDGKYHPVDSSESSFKHAGSIGFKEAAVSAHPTLLEPIMDVEVTVPEDFTGDIMGDLNSRRAHLHGMQPDGGLTTISASVPYAEMLRYATDLRSMTQGRGSYTMHVSHYQEVPANIQQQIVEKHKKEVEAKAALAH
ncbi:MAG: elongation factor G [Chloroflexota bacterium]